jgi:nucleotide-binding universal stress UspA family protein
MKKPKGPLTDLHVIVDLGGDRAATALAAALARRLDAHLTGVALSFEPLIPSYPMTAPIPTDIIVAARESALAEAAAAVAGFEGIVSGAGIEFATQSFEAIAGSGFADVTEACRLSDLVVVSQEDPDRPEPMRGAVVEALLFDAAAPTLLVPYAGVNELKTDRAVIAWDGSAQASRALRAAIPLLKLTASVKVLIVAEEAKWATGVPGADVAGHLARHGISVEVTRLNDAVNDIATTLLNTVAEEEADWMVMGAYGHSRMRQLFLGGVTRRILATATIPVLMAH